MHLCPRAERIDRLAISLVQAYITTARNHCPSCAGNRVMSYWFGYSETGGQANSNWAYWGEVIELPITNPDPAYSFYGNSTYNKAKVY